MKSLLSLLLFCGLFVQVTSCSKDDECSTTNITYSNTVKSIFDSNCTLSGCHNSGSVNGSLASYDDAKNFPRLNRMVGALRREAGFVAMPQGTSPLGSCDIDQIEAWIAAGTPN